MKLVNRIFENFYDSVSNVLCGGKSYAPRESRWV